MDYILKANIFVFKKKSEKNIANFVYLVFSNKQQVFSF
jgi:hypothetical protein